MTEYDVPKKKTLIRGLKDPFALSKPIKLSKKKKYVTLIWYNLLHDTFSYRVNSKTVFSNFAWP